MLDPAVTPGDKSVHDVRVLLKKSRAVLKLIRLQVNEAFFNREYSTLRETGRMMSSWRENSVHRKILKDLRKRHPDVFGQLENHAMIHELLEKPVNESALPANGSNEVLKIIKSLNKSGFRIRFEPLAGIDPVQLFKELENTFTGVMECYLLSRNDPVTKNLHEFRKRAKDLLYQLYFFRPIAPPQVKSLEKKMDAITRNIGKHHDLAMLLKAIGYKYPGENSAPLNQLVLIIRGEQDRCLSKVWPTAYRIFCPGNNLMSLMGFKILMI